MTSSPAGKKSALPSAGRWWWRLLRVVVVGYLLLILLLMLFENALIFPAPKYPDGDWNPAGLKFEEVTFHSKDGTACHGWFVEHERPRGVVLFCHGNGEHVGYLAPMLSYFHDDLELSIFAWDYRGYGKSQGKPHEKGVLQDAEAAHQWLLARTGLPAEKIILMGRSLGGAVAVDLAARHGARALVLENTFSSLPEVVSHHYPHIPVKWLLRTRFDSLSKICDYSGPLLQTHGQHDSIVPLAAGKKLFDACPSPRKEFIEYQGQDHNDPQPARYYAKLMQFLAEN